MATTATFLTEFRSSMTFEYKSAMDVAQANAMNVIPQHQQHVIINDRKSPDVSFEIERALDIQHSPSSSRGTSLASSPALPIESAGITNGLSDEFVMRDGNMDDPLSDDSMSMPNDLSGYNGDQDEMPSPLAQLQCALEKNGMLGKKLNLPAYPGSDNSGAMDRNGFTLPQIEDGHSISYDEMVYKCHLCSYASNSKPHFNSHMNSHFDHKCPRCNYSSRTEGRLKRHIKDFHSETPPESWAGTRVPRNEGSGGELSMDDSVSSTGNNNNNKPRTYRCKQCDFVAYKKNEFWDHNKTHIKAEKLLTCPQCAFVTEYKHHLEYHIRNHFGSKPFKCGKCNYSCVNKSMLNSHMKSHSNIYQYRCSNCSYATKYCHSLKLHLRKYDHKPASVLNVDGTPNPYPIIDVYGTRRGPRPKKRKYIEGSNTNGITNTPVTSSQASVNYSNMTSMVPANMPMLYPPQFFNGYHGNIFVRPPTNCDGFSEMSPHRSPRFGISPSHQHLKCLLCDFVTEHQEILHKHMLLHAAKENQDLIKLYGINSETIMQMQEQQMAANNYLHHSHNNNRYAHENETYKVEIGHKSLKLDKMHENSRTHMPELIYTPFNKSNQKVSENETKDGIKFRKDEKEDLKIFEQTKMESDSPDDNQEKVRKEDQESNITSRSVIVSHKTSIPTSPASPKEQSSSDEKVSDVHSILKNQNVESSLSVPESSPLDLSNGKTNDFQSSVGREESDDISRSPDEVIVLSEMAQEPSSESSPNNGSQTQPRNRRKGKAFKLDRYLHFEDNNSPQIAYPNIENVSMPENNGIEHVHTDAVKPSKRYSPSTKAVTHQFMNNLLSISEHRNSQKFANDLLYQASMRKFDDRMVPVSLSLSDETSDIQGLTLAQDKTLPVISKSPDKFPQNSPSPVEVPQIVPKNIKDITSGVKETDSKWQDAYMCTYCDMAFRDCVMYTMHMGYHGYGDPYTCNMCGYESKDKVEFFLHIARAAHS